MCAWDEFSEFLQENRVPTSADFNTYPIRIFFSGFIMEWEDSYPLNVLQMYPQDWVYSREEAARMVKVAEDCGLIVIPLVQTFGHLEYVLKHFTYLREHPERCDCLIPIGKYLLSRIYNTANPTR